MAKGLPILIVLWQKYLAGEIFLRNTLCIRKGRKLMPTSRNGTFKLAAKSSTRRQYVFTLDVPHDVVFRASVRGKGEEDPMMVALRIDHKREVERTRRGRS